MKTMRSRFLNSSAAVATAAILAFWFTVGGPQVVRADDPEAASFPGQEVVLVSAKSMDALEQRVIYLEQKVAALTESWQHINTHRLCVSDDSGAEACITKAQLDSFLNQASHSEITQPAVSEQASAPPPAVPIESAAAIEPSSSPEPTTVIGENVPPEQADPETTGTVSSAISGAAVVQYPKVEIYEEPAGRSDE
jgi:hypothetical protein